MNETLKSNIQEGLKMVLKKESIKSLLLGLFIGIFVMLVLGAAGGNSPGRYQVSISANNRNVFYAKINSVTGEIETWQSSITSVPNKR
jgi:hypothetical protein